MKIVHTHAATLYVLAMVSASPVLASQAGVNAVRPASQAGVNAVRPASQAGVNAVRPASQAGVNAVRPASQAGVNAVRPASQAGVNSAGRSTSVASSGVPTKARCEVDEMLGSISCD